MTSSPAWKRDIVHLQESLCFLCDKHVGNCERSWDHFIPQAYSGPHRRYHRIGLVWLAHERCNAARGHAPPTSEMIEKAVSLIARMPHEHRMKASDNIERLLAEQRVFVRTLEAIDAGIAEFHGALAANSRAAA